MWPVRALGMGEEIKSVWIDKNCEKGQVRNQIANIQRQFTIS